MTAYRDRGIDNAKFSDFLYRIEQMLDHGADKKITCSGFLDPNTDCELAITGLIVDAETQQPYLTGIHYYSEEIPEELEERLSAYKETAITLSDLSKYVKYLTTEQLAMPMKAKAQVIDPRSVDLRDFQEVVMEDVHIHSLRDNIGICKEFDSPISFMCCLVDFDFANNWER